MIIGYMSPAFWFNFWWAVMTPSTDDAPEA